jgi:hypothetical protein
MNLKLKNMELLSTRETDLKIVLATFDGCVIRLFMDNETNQIYCDLADLETILFHKPDRTNYQDWREFKKSILQTLKIN